MTSPFPGMDPYLEKHWNDVHVGLMVNTADALNEPLPDALVARIEGEETADGVERHLEIRGAEDGRLITAIEVLKPSVRSGAGREAYLERRRRHVERDANVVEIDLVRAGEHPVGIAPDRWPAPCRTLYAACIWRAARRRWEVYPLPLRQRLLVVSVPLRPDEPDAILDLQMLIDKTYRRGRYDRLRYAEPLDPPLMPEDAEWVQATLRAAGRVAP